MDQTIIVASRQLFRFKGKEHRIEFCGIQDEKGIIVLDPPNSELEKLLKDELERTGGLKVYLGHSYICFPDDYPQELY